MRWEYYSMETAYHYTTQELNLMGMMVGNLYILLLELQAYSILLKDQRKAL